MIKYSSIFTIFGLLLILISCSTKIQEYNISEVEKSNVNLKQIIKKDENINTNNKLSLRTNNKVVTEEANKEKTEIKNGENIIKKNISGKVNIDENNNTVITVNLQNNENIKKYEEEKYEYEKLKKGLSSELVNQNISKLLWDLKLSSLPKGIDYKSFDKVFFEKINSGIYNDLKNLKTINILKSEVDINNVLSEVTEEKGLDKDMKEIVVKKITYYYGVNVGGYIYKVSKDKLDKYLNDSSVKSIYISRGDPNIVYPISNLGLSGYFLEILIKSLQDDGKIGVLQYFGSLQSLLPTSGISDEHIIIKHQKYLDQYISSIIRKL